MNAITRRQFAAGFGAVAAWPLAAHAQQQALPVVGYLYSGSPETSASWVSAFRQGLSEQGFIEGRNVAIEYRWANNQPDQLSELANDLVRRRVSVIVTPGTSESVLAAKAATTTIPIVFRTGGDPVALGLVASINRPGGNVTGINALSLETVTKRLGLLHELLPKAASIAVLFNPHDPNAVPYTKELEAAASSIGRQLDFFGATTPREIDVRFSDLVNKRPGGLLVVSQGLLINRRVQIVTQAARHMLPAVYPQRDFADIGGLMSYGPNSSDQWRLTGVYTGRMLKGESPTNLPVLRTSKFELVINVQTARILEIEIPTTLLASADEVIE
jgi:putative ABC transport system substrate-binding protein